MPKKEKRLTVNQLRSYPGLENLTDDEANDTIDTLVSYSRIVYEIYIAKGGKISKILNE